MKKQTISNGMKTQLIQTTKTIILALILTLGISYVMAWTGPTSTPPDGNTPAPVNVGTTDQVKNGGLGINALSVFGTGYVEKLKINETGDTGAWELYTDGDTYTSGTLRTDGIANCKTTSQMTDTNAITLCPDNQFLDGDGSCRTASQIVGDGGGGGGGACHTLCYGGGVETACEVYATSWPNYQAWIDCSSYWPGYKIAGYLQGFNGQSYHARGVKCCP
jgi:hypothetical protein